MSFLPSILTSFSADTTIRALQVGLLAGGAVLVFLLLYATRDILLRTHSFLYQFFCIVLVALLPGLGFLLYLLIRPARTVKERETERMLRRLTERMEAAEEDIDALELLEMDESQQDSDVIESVTDAVSDSDSDSPPSA